MRNVVMMNGCGAVDWLVWVVGLGVGRVGRGDLL